MAKDKVSFLRDPVVRVMSVVLCMSFECSSFSVESDGAESSFFGIHGAT